MGVRWLTHGEGVRQALTRRPEEASPSHLCENAAELSTWGDTIPVAPLGEAPCHGYGSTRRKFIHGVRSSAFRVPVRGAASQNGDSRLNRYFFLGGTTASLNALAKRNLTTVFAGMLIGSPV